MERIKNFTKEFVLERKIPEFKNRITGSQLSFIMSLRKKQFGKVSMNFDIVKKYMTKQDAIKLIDVMKYEYFDIIVRLKDKPIKWDDKPITDGRMDNTQMTMARLDMLETQISNLK